MAIPLFRAGRYHFQREKEVWLREPRASKGKALLILPWKATFTNEVGFHAGPTFPIPC